MMPYILFVARTHGTCAYTQIFKRQRERQATILSFVARVVAPCAFTPYYGFPLSLETIMHRFIQNVNIKIEC